MASFKQSSADLEKARSALMRELTCFGYGRAKERFDLIERYVDAKIGAAFEQFSDALKVVARKP